MKTAVIVGRFQCHELHDGYLYLMKQVYEDLESADKFVIVIGDTEGQRTNRNPLTYEVRKEVIKNDCPYIIDAFRRITDHPSDEEWSRRLDRLLADLPNPVLYGSRDSFIPYYKGKLPTKELQCKHDLSSTKQREEVKNNPNIEEFPSIFARGMIYVQENKYPVVYPTVDVAVMQNGHILLGRKPGMMQWCLIGGFVDPVDESLEAAAHRELREEVPGIIVGSMSYVCSMRITDYRYQGSKDGITTTLFQCNYNGGQIQAGDDIAEARWFPLNQLKPEEIQSNHRQLIIKLQLQ
jgi:bifunctional NMN adenylyltransferase/nudix hydrolase